MPRIILLDFDSSLFDSKQGIIRFKKTAQHIIQQVQANDHLIIYSFHTSVDDIDTILYQAGIDADHIELLGKVETDALYPGMHGRMLSKALLSKIEYKATSVIFVTSDKNIDTQLEHVFNVLVPKPTHSVDMQDFLTSDNYLKTVLFSDKLLTRLKGMINDVIKDVNTSAVSTPDPRRLSSIYDELSLLAYRIKRSDCSDEYYSKWAEYLGGTSYSRAAKLEATEQLLALLRVGMFNKSHLPAAAKNGELSKIVNLIEDCPAIQVDRGHLDELKAP